MSEPSALSGPLGPCIHKEMSMDCAVCYPKIGTTYDMKQKPISGNHVSIQEKGDTPETRIIGKPQTTLKERQLAYLKKVFEKFHTDDDAGQAMAHSYAVRVLDCIPKEEGRETI